MNQARADKITKYIFLDHVSKQKADIAMIFGTRSWFLPLARVFGLYQQGLASKIIFSGGVNRHTGLNESRKMAEGALLSGVHHDDILIEDCSTNTLENVLFSRKILDEHVGLSNIKSVIAIVKHFHSRRCLMTLKKHLPGHISVRACPYPILGFTHEDWHSMKTGRKMVLGEVKKIKKYLRKGDLQEL